MDMLQSSSDRQFWWGRRQPLVPTYRGPKASSIGYGARSFSDTRVNLASDRRGAAQVKVSKTDVRVEKQQSSSRWVAAPSAGRQSSATARRAVASHPSKPGDRVGAISGAPKAPFTPFLGPGELQSPSPAALPSHQSSHSRPNVSTHSLRYKEAARRWTSVMIAMPILVVTSYFLYDRLALGNRSKLEEMRQRSQNNANEGIQLGGTR
ncbi:hypothetical protein BD289DRAFT_25562 [Coniella lustricola]|uniref:Uncharacterized protein n=1 Tax=Coniella lustricola TaxID=2025994 RepID=A0A2T3A340_9PEZI|nr:hypothetical protein BD289DRAFT_25562 [Coniella lustricola]